jgi:hypothetical protein
VQELNIKIRIIKALAPAAAESLRKSSIPIDFLKAKNNSIFLLEERQELTSLDKVPVAFKNTAYIKPSFSEKFGPFIFPAFNFSEDSDEVVHLEIAKAVKKRNKVPCEIALGFLKYSKTKARIDTFKLEIAFNRLRNEHPRQLRGGDYFVFDIKDTYRNNYIFNIATYFYNKFELYRQVKTFFMAKKEKLVKITENTAFLDDVLSLLSAAAPTASGIVVPKENLSKELILNPITDKLPGYKSLFTYMDYTNKAITNETRDGIEVFVGENTDTLAITFNLDFESSVFTKNLQKTELTLEILNKFKNTTPIAEMFYKNIAASLENYLLLGAFSSNLISQVKTKFLLKALKEN